MTVTIPEPLRTGVLERLMERLFPEWKRIAAQERRRIKAAFAQSFESHLSEVRHWARAQHAGAVDAPAEGLATVPLDYSTIPRRYGHRGQDDLWTEEQLLESVAHLAVLGDPGAGKTTTLRRFAGMISDDVDDARFVVLIVCREKQWNELSTLHDHISSVFGLGGLDLDADRRARANADFLNGRGVLIVDGLDEVPRRERTRLENDLALLARRLDNGQIILSCRTADYPAPIENIVRVEILPLDHRQIAQVMNELLGSSDGSELFRLLITEGHPVGELADRPLFLLRLIALYRRNRSIPERVGEIYDAIIEMMLETWDAVRRVNRRPLSEYGKLETGRKREFLSELALVLLQEDFYSFQDDDLSDAYSRLAPSFGLPADQARLVAREIESHTGLIVDSGVGFEFSHASIQEYLAAEAVYRHGEFDAEHWTRRRPVVAAVAIARSADPAALLADVTRERVGALAIPPPVLATFLARVGLERPRFSTASTALGRNVLLLAYRAQLSDARPISVLVSLPQVRDSISAAIDALYDIGVERERVDLTPKEGVSTAVNFVPPLWFTHAVFGEFLSQS